MKKRAIECLMTPVYYVNRVLPNPRVICATFCSQPYHERPFGFYTKPSIKPTRDSSWFVSHTDTSVNNMSDSEIMELQVYDTFEEAAKEAGWM